MNKNGFQFQKYLFFLLLGSAVHHTSWASASCDNWPKWTQHACQRFHQILDDGSNELYLTGYAWHNRYTYDRERLNTYNENAWGGGFGKGFFDEDGDWHGLSAIAFLDSHKNVQPAAGYTFLKMLPGPFDLKVGLGGSVLMTARPDIFNNIPFPGVLPWLSLNYKHLWLQATYVPGAQDAGNVLFLMAKWTF